MLNEKQPEQVLRSSSNLFRIQIADLQVSKYREEFNKASLGMELWKLRKVIAEWESRTGLNHSELLKGDFHDPYNDHDSVTTALAKAVRNLLNGISTGVVKLDSDEDERYANAISALNMALHRFDERGENAS